MRGQNAQMTPHPKQAAACLGWGYTNLYPSPLYRLRLYKGLMKDYTFSI